MKQTKISVLLASLMAAGFMLSGQAMAADATASASATIVTPIAISKTTDMSFGGVLATAGAGTVVLATNNDRTAVGVTLVDAATGTAAEFLVQGQPGYTYAITLPASTSLTGTGAAMTVDEFTSNPGTTGTLAASGDNAGKQDLLVGATLNVGETQAAGTYTGTFSVTVAYN